MLLAPARSLYSRGAAGSGGGGGSSSNRPDGLTTVWRQTFTAGTYGNATWGTTNGSTTGAMYLANRVTGGWTAVTDAAAPRSPDYIRFNYLTGFAYGGEPALYDAWGASETAGDGKSYRTMYHRFSMRMMPGNGTSWELPDGGFPGIKAGGYWGVANRNGVAPRDQGPFQVLMFLGAASTNATQFNVRVLTQIDTMGNQQTASQLPGLADPYPVKAGQWHDYELLFELGTVAATNAATPSGDGRVRVWLDNTNIIDNSTMAFVNSTDQDGFWGHRGAFVLGGNSGPAKTRNDYVDVSDSEIAVGAQVEP